MSLLNPPELRPSVLLLILRYLAGRRGQRDQFARLVATLAPIGLSPGTTHDLDVRLNLVAATELGLVLRSGDEVTLAEAVLKPIRKDEGSAVVLLRQRVFDDHVNSTPWGSQVGARDLTNALAWFLTFSADTAPIQMEGGARSAKDLQEADFGPRQASGRPNDPDLDSSGWPIANPTRWNSFRRWACSLGFAWVRPNGQLVPDPTPAIRDALPSVFDGGQVLVAEDFMAQLAQEVPVLDFGRYRDFVEKNWRRPPPEEGRLSAPTVDALERLKNEGRLIFDDRADAPRVTRADGSTFSHVRKGGSR